MRLLAYGQGVQTWKEAIDGWCLALRAGGRAETTIRTRRDHLMRLSRWADGRGPWEITTGDLVSWTGAHQWKPEYRRSVRASLRSFYGWAHGAGVIAEDPARGLPAVKSAVPSPRPVPEAIYRRALQEASARNPRHRILLRLAAECGLRRAEVAQVHVGRDLIDDLVGWSLIVHGKGGKERIVPLPRPLALELRALGGGWAFPSRNGDHWSPRWVGKIVTTYLPEDWTMHKLRHRFATEAHEAERDLLVVAELLGHASVATTQRYVATNRDRLRRAVEAVAV